MKKQILTPRLRLDAISEKDCEALGAIFTSDTVKQTYMLPDFESDAALLRLLERIRDLSLSTDRYVYGIFLDSKLIGVMNDTDIDGKTIEMGYALHPDHYNKGYATEAFGAMIAHLFECGFDTVLAAAFEENPASLRVMQKCGMHLIEKTEDIEYRGRTHKCVYYSINELCN